MFEAFKKYPPVTRLVVCEMKNAVGEGNHQGRGKII